MRKTKKELILEIKLMASNINAFHERLNIRENHLYIHKEIELFTVDLLREAYKWLKGIYDVQFKQYHNTWKLLTPEQWARYFRWGGFEDHQEMIQLKKHVHELRTKLVSQKRPDLFKKGKADGWIKKKQKRAAEKRR